MKSVILTMGLNHTTAPIQIREQVPAARCTREEARDSFLLQLDRLLFLETFVLSTCNRTEIYAVATDGQRGEQALRQIFSAHESFPTNAAHCLHTYSEHEAAAHLFAVAASIDRGVYLAPSQFEALFVSLAHTQADISRTIERAAQVFQRLDR